MEMKRKILTIEGMTCINCQNRIEQTLKKTAGISNVHVSYSKGQAEIEFDPEVVSLKRIITIIEELDYEVVDGRKRKAAKIIQWIGTFAVIILLYYLLQHYGILN